MKMTVKLVIYDFNGVAIDRMTIKTRVLSYLSKIFPKKKLWKNCQIHIGNDTMSRFKKFHIIYCRKYLNKTIKKTIDN